MILEKCIIIQNSKGEILYSGRGSISEWKSYINAQDSYAY